MSEKDRVGKKERTKSDKGNAVANHLGEGDRGAHDDDRTTDKENVFYNTYGRRTGQGLMRVMRRKANEPERVRTRDEALPMRKTTAMLRRRAVLALAMRKGRPTLGMICWNGAQPS